MISYLITDVRVDRDKSSGKTMMILVFKCLQSDFYLRWMMLIIKMIFHCIQYIHCMYIASRFPQTVINRIVFAMNDIKDLLIMQ